ncbi:MAG TPA: hypothetical protein VM327_01205 [Candidatus Thermoplasmatota archaeon]|nr:hypothetical protein [Candidatus Thermoplasmatota archaeon]
MGTRKIECWTAGLSIGAGAVHGIVAPAHFEEWWGYGLFFLFSGTAQLVLGLALLAKAFNEVDSGPAWLERRRAMLWVGIVGNLLIMGLYLVSRTTGVPWFGPEAGEVEAVAPIDLLSKGLEAATIVGLYLLLRNDAAEQSSLATI